MKIISFISAVLVVVTSTYVGHTQDSDAAKNNRSIGRSLGPYDNGAIGSTLWAKYLPEIADGARKLGYTVRIAPADFGTFDVFYTKVGKTDEAHGLLGKKWDEREIIYIRYLPTQSGIQLTSVKRVVEQKAPIGQWKTVVETSEIPPQLLITNEKSKN